MAKTFTKEETDHFIEVNGIKVHYNEAGSVPALICTHGGGPGANAWDNTKWALPYLAEHFQTILLDMPGFGDSHFYSASASECAAVTSNPKLYPGWTLESASVFFIALPNATTGNCGAGTQPVWRFYNARTINHRYTTDHTTRDAMRADPGTWTPEGYGPDSVIMCAPVGT